MTNGFDLGHDLDLEFSRSNIEIAISQPKMVRLPRNEKQTYRLNSKASNVTIRFDLSHDFDLEFSRSNMEFPISQPKVVWLPRNEKQAYRLNSRPRMGSGCAAAWKVLEFSCLSGKVLEFCHCLENWVKSWKSAGIYLFCLENRMESWKSAGIYVFCLCWGLRLCQWAFNCISVGPC